MDNRKSSECAPIQKALDYLHEYYTYEIDLDTLSGIAGLSKYHFSREFKRETQSTYRSYLRNLRMKEAMRLLQFSDRTIGEIGIFVGYGDHTSFGKFFKQDVGLTPSEYRNKTRNSNPDRA